MLQNSWDAFPIVGNAPPPAAPALRPGRPNVPSPQTAEQIEGQRLINDQRRLDIDERRRRANITARTPGQQALDRNFAREYNDWRATGGYADVQRHIGELRGVADELGRRGDLTGPVVGNLPDRIGTIVAPTAVDTRETVEQVVQRNLRLILGAQFTEREGERLIARAYNPRLDEATNRRRVLNLLQQIEAAAAAREDASNYFEEHGTLSGWRGRLHTAQDFDPEREARARDPLEGVGGSRVNIGRIIEEVAPPQPQRPEGRVVFGDEPLPPENTAAPIASEMQAAYDRGASREELLEIARRAGVQPDVAEIDAALANRRPGRGGGARFVPEAETPITRDSEGLRDSSLDAGIRGAADVLTLGLSDEIAAAGDTITGGGTYQENLYRQRGLDRFDSENNFGARLTGQIGAGLVLPTGYARGAGRFAFGPPATVRGAAALGGAYGGAYGFGSGEGDLGDRATSAFTGTVIGAGAGAVGQRVASAFTRAPRNADRRELIEAADRLEVPITRLEAGGIGTRMAGGVVGRTPGGIPMASGVQASLEGSQAARDRIAGAIGAISDDAGAGQAAQRGARSFLERSQGRASELFNRVPISQEQAAQTTGARAALAERTAGMESNQMLGEMFREPRLEGYLAALEGRATQLPTGILDAQGNPIMRTVQEGGGLSWGDLRRFRSLVGEMIEQPTVASEGTSTAALRRLYAGISQDMEATASSVSPRALTAVRRANQYYRGREARREGLISEILGPNFDQGAQAAFEQINRWAQQRGGNFARLGQALRSMPEDEANAVRASIFARMGRASAGRQDEAGTAFSPAEFATQWHRLEPRARSFLAPDAAHRNALNDLVRITTAQKRGSQYANFSNTSLGTNAVAFFGGLAVEPFTAITAALGSLGAGRFLASPAAARWLATGASTRNPQAHIRRLSAIASRNPAIAQEALDLQRVLMSVANDNVGTVTRSAASDGADPDSN